MVIAPEERAVEARAKLQPCGDKGAILVVDQPQLNPEATRTPTALSDRELAAWRWFLKHRVCSMPATARHPKSG
jgi:hypothetical protein